MIRQLMLFHLFPNPLAVDPYIRVKKWKVGVHNGSTAKLECEVEAFPVAVTYWEDEHGLLLENSTKYSIFYHQNPNSVWKVRYQCHGV